MITIIQKTRSISNRGALFIEYALLFAFITLGGLIFISFNNDGIAQNDKKVISKAADMLEIAAGSAKNLFSVTGQGIKKDFFWHENGGNDGTDSGWHYTAFASKQLIDLTPGDYKIEFDIAKFQEITGTGTEDDLLVHFMGYDTNDLTKNVWNTGKSSDTKYNNSDFYSNATAVKDAKNYSTTITINKNMSLGFNFEDLTTDNGKSSYNNVDQATIDKAITESMKITKIEK